VNAAKALIVLPDRGLSYSQADVTRVLIEREKFKKHKGLPDESSSYSHADVVRVLKNRGVQNSDESVDKKGKVFTFKDNITNPLQHLLNELLHYKEHELKTFIGEQSDTVKGAMLLFAVKVINVLSIKLIQNTVENNKEVREVIHASYIALEDALNVSEYLTPMGDLYSERQVLAKKIVNAAKAVKETGVKFDPSIYLPNYECYSSKKHGDAAEFLKIHYSDFLSSENEEEVDYLWRGDIKIIDPVLYRALNLDHREQFKNLVKLAGKKSCRELDKATKRALNKAFNINKLKEAARK